jgi:hypothetical protein
VSNYSVQIDGDGTEGDGLSFTLDGDHVEVDIGIDGWPGPFSANARITLGELRWAMASLEAIVQGESE